MERYFLSDGGAAVTGPFLMTQLRGRFERGELSADAVVCLECVPGEEEWQSLAELVEREQRYERHQVEERESYQRRRAKYERMKPMKSETKGLIYAVLLTGAGHMYAGEVLTGVVVLVLALVFASAGIWWVAILLVLLSWFDAPRAVKRWNDANC